MVGSEAEGSGAAGWEAARAAEATVVVEDSEAAMARVAMASVMVRAAARVAPARCGSGGDGQPAAGVHQPGARRDATLASGVFLCARERPSLAPRSPPTD